MTDADIEKYYFYRLYSIDLDSTKYSLRVLKRYRRKDVRHCLLRDVVVSYVRPFSGNKGQVIPKHKLTKKVVPRRGKWGQVRGGLGKLDRCISGKVAL